MKKLLFVVLASMLLAGCPGTAPKPQKPPVAVNPPPIDVVPDTTDSATTTAGSGSYQLDGQHRTFGCKNGELISGC
ncbi:hypothetical protein [Budvicia aquatica]|uniref:Lipoprotein n=1 Tax=Budvicia aquatica TaxID=82979 RepID=A0A484ZSY5_9GAMM|nr:hypothetical protein [Budvicia aquatica]VFS51494.1 Uncharacterised protein [Budvicia aquatica]